MWASFEQWLADDAATLIPTRQPVGDDRPTDDQPRSDALICLDMVGDGAAGLKRLSALYESKIGKKLSHGVHYVWITDLESLPMQPPPDLPIDLGQWPAPLPGIHRSWFNHAPFEVSLTIVIAQPHSALTASTDSTDSTLLAELALTADWVLVSGYQPVAQTPILSAVCAAHSSILSLTDRHVQQIATAQILPNAGGPDDAQASRGLADPRVLCAKTRRAVIVGAGISGLTTAAVLGLRGWSVTVLDPHPPGLESRHAQHLAAALTPVVSSDDNERSQLARAGALAADRFWSELPTIIGRRCGALQLQKPESQRRWVDLRAVSKAFGMPAWARWVDAAQASELAALPLSRGGLWMPGAWLVQVASLLKVLATMPGVTVVSARANRVRRQAGHWQVLDDVSNPLAEAPILVLANASDTYHLLQRSGLNGASLASKKPRLASLHQLAGEITCLPAQALSGGPTCIVGGDGYVLPAVDGWCVSGGTYVRNATAAGCTTEGIATNIKRAGELLDRPDLTQTIESRHLPGWAGFRAVLPGRLPAIGPACDPTLNGLWIFSGGASRGLTWSVLGAELIADALSGTPLALKKSLIDQISPGL